MEEKKLDKYIFNPEEVLGKGSFGIVYKGLRNLEGKSQVVALKKIPAEILQDKSKLQSLYNEISISGKINVEDKKDNENKENKVNKENNKENLNDNIVNFLDITDIKNNTYLVYEYCNGGDLKRYLRFFKTFDEKMVQNIMTKIIKGLQVLHNKKIIHHDIKPENILVDLYPNVSNPEEEQEIIRLIKEKTDPKNKRSKQFDNIMPNELLLEVLSKSKMKLSDFGLSKYKVETNKVEIAGSPLYIDPNLLKSDSKLETVENEKVDIWALGIIAYELFFYDLPFQPFPPSIERLKQLFQKGEYTIDFKRHDKISKQFISFLNVCLQDEQKIRPLTDELLFHEFIVRDPEEFTYITIDNYKDAKYPEGDYLREEGKITMSIKDNRMINAYFDWLDNVKK